ncbi:hypothetical protein HN777_00070 [Candidatus Woesearchaeota archaeon]|jgi:hypothetical protein|nr:hypothetical protein [Candidatus Woesearchaeota archaeon]
MGVFRFSNAVSDIRKFIQTYTVLYSELKNTKNFSHDDATDVLIKHGLVSSSGAIGEEAKKRSQRTDRSRDSLYNQHKMYSEIYRMLGWYEPGNKRTNFNFTEFGKYIIDATDSLLIAHFEFSATHIVSPNPLVEVRGRNILRPFPLILKLMNDMEGVITRDEIILGVLNCQNDKASGFYERTLEYLTALRGSCARVKREIVRMKRSNDITSDDTLKNYTRFPLASLRFLNWAEDKRNKEIYDKSINAYHITDKGKKKVQELQVCTDIRNEELQGFSMDARASFTLLMIYINLERIGYDINNVEKFIEELTENSKSILTKYGIKDKGKILYSAIQESQPNELKEAHKLAKLND